MPKGQQDKRRKRQRNAAEDDISNSNNIANCWRPVNVQLTGDDDNDFQVDDIAEDDTPRANKNHYDDPKLQRRANKDLPVQPGEDIAFFYGLEVLDSSQYQLVPSTSADGEKTHRLVIRPSSSSSPSSQGKDKVVTEEKSKNDSSTTKKKKRKVSVDEDDDENDAKADTTTPKPRDVVARMDEDKPSEAGTTKAKKAKKKKKKSKPDKDDMANTPSAAAAAKSPQEDQEVAAPESASPSHPVATPEQVREVQLSWSHASGGAVLHEKLCQSLATMGYIQPTPIQSATLSAAVMGRRNLVGAAPTGSGKTLAFLLPIVQHLMEQAEDESQDDDKDVVQALIVTPTRELALQIHAECEKLLPKSCVSLVGGIALVKQDRLLTQIKPRIVIGTPGRLWAMISSGGHPHMSDLSQIRFLVLDEADRMVQKHCFPQLVQILEAVHTANPGPEQDEDDDDADESDDEDVEDYLGSLPGVRGESKVTMLTDDILRQMASLQGNAPPEIKEVPDEEFEEAQGSVDVYDELEDTDFPPERPHVHRQTFIYSATLTMPQTETKVKTNNKKKGRRQDVNLDGPIADILSKTRAKGETKIVDLAMLNQDTQSGGGAGRPNGVQLPPGLHLELVKCTQRHKDSHLYAYLVTTAQGASGPCLVFCNSIAGVRRVGTTLQKLGLPIRILHAHMQQRARFKAVESLQDPNSRTVVVCSDVASRGLDIPSVATVVHYDAARSVDTFVHRSGRTARGVGARAVGTSLSLVAPAEDKAHRMIADAVQAKFANVVMDGRLLTAAQTRTNLASKIVAAEELEHKTQSSNKWFREKAEEVGLEIDDDLVEDESNRAPREQAQLQEAKKAKVELARLLREPMKAQRFGKFLSSVMPANYASVTPHLKKKP